MSKNALGRGLSSLMGDKPKSENSDGQAEAASELPASPGVGSLLRGSKRDEQNVFAEPAAKSPESPELAEETQNSKPLIPRWYFFAADVLLIAFALAVVFKNPWPLNAKQAAVCVVSIVLAAVLGAVGVWMGSKPRQ